MPAPLSLAYPSVRATLVKIPSGGNDGVKKLDRGLDAKGKRRQLVDGRVFGGNQVCGQRNGTFVDGAEESHGEERAVKLERVCYFGRGLVSNAIGDQETRRGR